MLLSNVNKILSLLLFTIIISSCSRNTSEFEKKDLRVLILGNSILKHPPSPNLGWSGDWGMAATSPDRDFLHLYNKLLIESNKYNDVSIDFKNISIWENDFNYNIKQDLDISTYSYDLLIIRLGENVSNKDEYYLALDYVIKLFKNEKTKVIITGIIWEDDKKENIHQQLAIDNQYKFISFASFRSQPENYSWGIYENSAVAAHPSDFGMENISNLLYNATLDVIR